MEGFSYIAPSKTSGFTLLELIIVIVIMGIMAVSLSSVTKNTVYSYIDAKDRNSLSQSAKWVTERISREMREALPQSVRTGTSVSGTVHCVEFMNILNASTYLNLPSSGGIRNFDAVIFDLAFSSGIRVAIMPINPANVYNLASGTLASVTSFTTHATDPLNQITINFPPLPAAATFFSRRSPHNRFYLLDSPVSFCLDDGNGELTRYSGYGISINQAFPPTGGASLMGENYTTNGVVFNYQDGTLSRAGLLQLNFKVQNRNRNLTGSEESFEIFHEVHIRNVP